MVRNIVSRSLGFVASRFGGSILAAACFALPMTVSLPAAKADITVERVWVDDVTREVTHRIWHAPVTEWVEVDGYDAFGRPCVRRQLVAVEPGYWETVTETVVVRPGHYETHYVNDGIVHYQN